MSPEGLLSVVDVNVAGMASVEREDKGISMSPSTRPGGERKEDTGGSTEEKKPEEFIEGDREDEGESLPRR